MPCPHPHTTSCGAAAGEGGRSKAESVTAGDSLPGSHIWGAEERGFSENKGDRSQPHSRNAGKHQHMVDHALLEMHFSICALTGPRPQAELSLAVKSTNIVPGPIFPPVVFKHCFQTAYQSHKGGTSDASLLKETNTAHGAKQGGNRPMPYRH